MPPYFLGFAHADFTLKILTAQLNLCNLKPAFFLDLRSGNQSPSQGVADQPGGPLLARRNDFSTYAHCFLPGQ